ncbi:class I SAM-dependent methyltransferase [Roseomonas hellenica]|uniref:Class I SAM-dependent methyltransferase n=1 Tax=Plastoroseomonas hellenica TaxID=2687306 RepID=A0ABS5EYM6_9PROT|nr:class I SAM-dependent methyltransferase [Plastoroseomonas hellenica]MBR0665389.1 class I SAM-dependent methyltransferase [Plastoroseomonas hellenica]
MSDASLIAATAARYAGAGRFAQGFVSGKLRRDPATAAILALGADGFGHLLDLGCGRGQLALALLLAGHATDVTGLDRAGSKIADAARAAEGLAARFEAADLATAPLPDCDTAMLIDVLYQMPGGLQRDLLTRVARVARRRVLIRAFDPDRGWRSAVGFAMEGAGRLLRGEIRRAAIAPLPLPALAAPLQAAGFAVRITPCWQGTPLPNVLLVAERQPDAS